MHNSNLIIITGLVGALSFGLYCISLVGLFARNNERMVLTYPETFANLGDIRDIFLSSLNYSALSNPLQVDHVAYPALPDTQEDFDDLQRRGLLAGLAFNESLVVKNSLLHRLMRTSWCSSGVSALSPALRNAGCRCISDAYLDFIRESLPINTSNLTTVTNVSLDVRQRAGDKVYRCWDQQLVTRSRHCGRLCTTHVGALAVFINIVFILVCASYVAFRVLDWNVYAIKFAIVSLAGVLCIAFLAKDADVNSLMLGGVGVCVFYLTVTLHSDISFENEAVVGPNSLMSALMLNLPLLLSAHAVQISVSGYGRDVWVFTSFAVCGGLLGVILQRIFWHMWYSKLNNETTVFQSFISKLGLIIAYVSLQVLLLLLFVAYYYSNSPYLGNSWFLFLIYELYLSLLLWLVCKDYAAMEETGKFSTTHDLTMLQGTIILGAFVANGVMTLVALIDLL